MQRSHHRWQSSADAPTSSDIHPGYSQTHCVSDDRKKTKKPCKPLLLSHFDLTFLARSFPTRWDFLLDEEAGFFDDALDAAIGRLAEGLRILETAFAAPGFFNTFFMDLGILEVEVVLFEASPFLFPAFFRPVVEALINSGATDSSPVDSEDIHSATNCTSRGVK